MLYRNKNKISVFLNEEKQWILTFPKYKIETKAYIGRNGVTRQKQEGDGKTPIGEFSLGILLSTHEKQRNKNGLKCQVITKDLYWVDDIRSNYYNQLVDITKVKKDWNSAEHLIEYPIQYEYLIEIKTN